MQIERVQLKENAEDFLIEARLELDAAEAEREACRVALARATERREKAHRWWNTLSSFVKDFPNE